MCPIQLKPQSVNNFAMAISWSGRQKWKKKIEKEEDRLANRTTTKIQNRQI